MKQKWFFQGKQAEVVWKDGRVVDVVYGPQNDPAAPPPLSPNLPPKHFPQPLSASGRVRDMATSLLQDGYTAASVATMLNVDITAVRRLLVTIRGIPGIYTTHGQKEAVTETA